MKRIPLILLATVFVASVLSCQKSPLTAKRMDYQEKANEMVTGTILNIQASLQNAARSSQSRYSNSLFTTRRQPTPTPIPTLAPPAPTALPPQVFPSPIQYVYLGGDVLIGNWGLYGGQNYENLWMKKSLRQECSSCADFLAGFPQRADLFPLYLTRLWMCLKTLKQNLSPLSTFAYRSMDTNTQSLYQQLYGWRATEAWGNRDLTAIDPYLRNGYVPSDIFSTGPLQR